MHATQSFMLATSPVSHSPHHNCVVCGAVTSPANGIDVFIMVGGPGEGVLGTSATVYFVAEVMEMLELSAFGALAFMAAVVSDVLHACSTECIHASTECCKQPKTGAPIVRYLHCFVCCCGTTGVWCLVVCMICSCASAL